MKKILFLLLLTPVACSNAQQDTPIRTIDDSLTVKNVIDAVWALPFKHKDVVVAQAVLESGWFKSKNCVRNNNLFGMRRAYTRTTTADSTIGGFAHYSNWRLSVIDYFLLQSTTESIYPTHSKAEYYHYLDRVYSEVGKGYSSQLKDIIKRIDLPEPENGAVDEYPVVKKQTTKPHHKKKTHGKKKHRND
jgi:hypothetical protein